MIVKWTKYCLAHASPEGENQEYFEKAVVMFKMESNNYRDVQVSWKTIQDTVNCSINERQERNRTNKLTLRNVKGSTSNPEQNLDSTIQNIDQFYEGRKKNECAAGATELVAAVA